MSFISMDFALFVLLALLLYYICPKKWRWFVLLVASYAFYWYNGADNLIYIVITTVSSYACAAFIENIATAGEAYIADNKESLSKDEKKSYKAGIKKKQKIVLICGLVINFGILIWLKYANFSIAYINFYRLKWFNKTDFIPFIRVLLPLGISFYTFQTMGYLIDIYYGKYEREHNLLKYALYVSFFPQIVQGPISRFGQLSRELYSERSFRFYNICSGFYRVAWGLFKKLVIADRLGGYVSSVMSQKEIYSGPYILLAIFFYSMQIYGDFSGGIDVAVGVAEMFGISLTENFERPFFSKSISQYWQRWHITLGTWFKDYIFYPLSLNKTIIKMGKKVRQLGAPTLGKRIPIYVPMLFVWALTGMWHGSESRYVVWGLMNYVFIVLGTELEGTSARIVNALKLSESGFIMRAYRAGKTFWLMSFLRLFDINKDTGEAFRAFRLLFTGWRSFDINKVYENLSLPVEDFVVALVAIGVLFIFELIQRKGSVRKRIFGLPTVCRWTILSVLVAAVAVFGYYGPGYDAASFIYGNF
ncbi:MAG: MBOAT family protein [Lachnospiraceae bacterium]|nr:MBOAT family protein [Lachnospiraceae bacterium]